MEKIHHFIHNLTALEVSVGLIAFIWLSLVGALALNRLVGNVFQYLNQRK